MITRKQAGRFLVALHFEDPFAGCDPVDRVIHHAKRLSCVQYDPLDVVGRNPDLVLQSRIAGYKPQMLFDALYKRRALIDGFDKNLAIYPIEDFPAFQRVRDRWFHFSYTQNEQVANSYPAILSEIDARGPLCSDDLHWTEKVSWPWGSANLARAGLESLWIEGKLILSHRKGSRRYFDRIEKHMPREILESRDPNETHADFQAWCLKRRIGSVGLLWNRASDAFLGIFDFKTAERNEAFYSLLQQGEILSVEVEDVPRPLYYLKRDQALFEAAMDAKPGGVARILAPLDNFLWDRKLIEALYGFEYRWEVYVPREKRQYGYYVLPVMVGDRFVARFEPRHFRGGKLVIENWWWEADIRPNARMKESIDRALRRFCAFLGAESYEVLSGF